MLHSIDLLLNSPKSLFESSAKDGRTKAAYEEALRICETLRGGGHVAYFAGGCVRDALLGRLPKDFDVATDATPDRVRDVFGKSKTLAFGAAFGVIGVMPEYRVSKETLEPTEVATFRSDGDYSDGRRPDQVHFGDAENDALRRDFTINGLFYDPSSDRIIDYVGGQQDLEKQQLRTIGAAKDRFEEDKLRMLRAVRFATTLGFHLAKETREEIVRRADEISVVSAERVGAEMRRVVTSSRFYDGLGILRECGLSEIVLPGVGEPIDDRLRSRLAALGDSAFEAALSTLLVSNARSPVEAIELLTERWRLSNEETRRVNFALRHWEVVQKASDLKWSTLQPILNDRDAPFAIAVAEAIARGDDANTRGVVFARETQVWPAEKRNPPPLLTGDSLREANYQPGPHFRVWLQVLRERQLDGEIATEAEAWNCVRELSESSQQ